MVFVLFCFVFFFCFHIETLKRCQSIVVYVCMWLFRIASNFLVCFFFHIFCLVDCKSYENASLKISDTFTADKLMSNIFISYILSFFFFFYYTYHITYTHVTCIHFDGKNRKFLCFKLSCTCMKSVRVEKTNLKILLMYIYADLCSKKTV